MDQLLCLMEAKTGSFIRCQIVDMTSNPRDSKVWTFGRKVMYFFIDFIPIHSHTWCLTPIHERMYQWDSSYCRLHAWSILTFTEDTISDMNYHKKQPFFYSLRTSPVQRPGNRPELEAKMRKPKTMRIACNYFFNCSVRTRSERVVDLKECPLRQKKAMPSVA